MSKKSPTIVAPQIDTTPDAEVQSTALAPIVDSVRKSGPVSKTVWLDFQYRAQSPAFYEVLLPEGEQGKVSWLRKSALANACVDDASNTVRVEMPRSLAVRRKLMSHEVGIAA